MRKSFILLAVFTVLAIIVATEARIDQALLSSIVSGKRCGANVRIFNGLFPNTTAPLVAQIVHGPVASPVITRTDDSIAYGTSSDYIKVFPGVVTVKVSFAANRTEVIKFTFRVKDNVAYSAAIVSYQSNTASPTGTPTVQVLGNPYNYRNATGTVLATARVSVRIEEVNPASAKKFNVNFYHNSLYNANLVDFTLTKGTAKTTAMYFAQGGYGSGSSLQGDFNYISDPSKTTSTVSVTVNGANVTTNVISPVKLSGVGLANIDYAIHFFGNAPGARTNPSTLYAASFFSVKDRWGCVHSALSNGASLPITLASYAFVDNTIGHNTTTLPNN